MPTKKWVDKIEQYQYPSQGEWQYIDEQQRAEIERLDKIRNDQHKEIKSLQRTLRDAHRCMEIYDIQGAWMILDEVMKGTYWMGKGKDRGDT